MRWHPDKLWDGEEAFIIGGGRSLRGWDFKLLEDEKTIGCNNAYQFGPKICNVCVFGDSKWLNVHAENLAKYVEAGGFVVTNSNQLQQSPLTWLNTMPRKLKGIHTDALGWNGHTGSVAINVAVLLGATTIYLLGFDRYFHKGQPNWHDHLLDKPQKETYERFNYADTYVARDLKNKFPDVKVFNVTNHSELTVWPKISLDKFWSERCALLTGSLQLSALDG